MAWKRSFEPKGKGAPPRMAIRMTGPRVGKARLSASDLAEIVRRTQQALQRVGQVLHGEESGGRGRKRREIEDLCELFLVGWQSGSAVAELELGEPPAQLNMFGYVGEQSLDAFVKGMNALSEKSVDSRNLPAGFDPGVLQSCDALAKVLDRGIDSVTFESRNGRGPPKVVLDAKLRDTVHYLLGQPVDVSPRAAKEGRLEELNGHGGLTGRLWEADGTRWVCHFKPEHLERLPDAWMRRVRIVGRSIVEEGKERTLEVELIVVLDPDLTEAVAGESAPFWESLSLQELIDQQGVAPATDLDEISALWPVDDDPDELLHHVLHERGARGHLTQRDDVA